MSFFSDYMQISTLDAVEEVNRQLAVQNETLRTISDFQQDLQDDIEYQKQIRNYIFNIGKKFKNITLKGDKSNPVYYVYLYFIMKELVDCGITTEDFDSISDKEYLNNLELDLEKTAKEYLDHYKNIEELNKLVEDVEVIGFIASVLESEKAKKALYDLNKEYKEFGKIKNKSGYVIVAVLFFNFIAYLIKDTLPLFSNNKIWFFGIASFIGVICENVIVIMLNSGKKRKYILSGRDKKDMLTLSAYKSKKSKIEEKIINDTLLSDAYENQYFEEENDQNKIIELVQQDYDEKLENITKYMDLKTLVNIQNNFIVYF